MTVTIGYACGSYGGDGGGGGGGVGGCSGGGDLARGLHAYQTIFIQVGVDDSVPCWWR